MDATYSIGCTGDAVIGDDALIRAGAVIGRRARIKASAVIEAGEVVTPNMEIKS